MNSKQLANVLIKMLGLSVCLHAIPSFIPSLIAELRILSDPLPPAAHSMLDHTLSYLLGTAVEIAIAIVFIVRSECVADRLFPTEEQTRGTPPAATP